MATIFDQLRRIPSEPIDANNVISLRHRGKMIELVQSATLLANTFSNGDIIGIWNDGGGPIIITPAAGLTLRRDNSPLVGAQSIAAKTMASIWFQNANTAVMIGAA